MKKVFRILGSLDAIVSGLSLVIIVSITIAGVIMRKFVGSPIAWLEEMQIFFFVWTVFLGGSVAFRLGNQVSIDLIAARLSVKARRILDVFDYFVSVFVIAWMGIGGWQLMQSPAVRRKVTPYFKIGYTWIDLAVPIGCALMLIQYTYLTVKQIRSWKQSGIEGGNAK